MEKTPQYYIVEAAALPEIFRQLHTNLHKLSAAETYKKAALNKLGTL